MVEIREYLDAKGNSPYAKWFKRQEADITAAKEYWHDYKRRKRQEVQ